MGTVGRRGLGAFFRLPQVNVVLGGEAGESRSKPAGVDARAQGICEGVQS